jgi:3-hydroxyisobutyrate dehydrogenase
MIGLAKAMDFSPDEVGTLFDHFNPGAAASARFKRVIDADYEHPSWELAMARKDARLMQEEAERAGIELAMLPAVAALMDRFMAEGREHADWTVVAKDVVGA